MDEKDEHLHDSMEEEDTEAVGEAFQMMLNFLTKQSDTHPS